eukprot:TRINITY_DN111823_c0_g1_i1.p1 TRINITY_DN111823_c0_g1~~TRINITY_DN111823_c0_g1_i1.p1  ORF type:complete len:264 (+),score=59.89 TRINITY_DN111823_c0_g1_i1:59-850(+)
MTDASLKPGVIVEINGLQSEAGKAQNGKKGILKNFLEDKGRWEVDLGNGKIMSLKADNLVRTQVKSRWAQASAEEEAAKAAEETAKLPFKPGQRVEVFGLESESGRKVNGKSGLVIKYLPEKGRFQVELGLENPMSLKPENLREVSATPTPTPTAPTQLGPKNGSAPSASTEGEAAVEWPPSLPFKLGNCVEVFGLDSETGKEINGEKGIVTGYDKTKDRVQVRVGDDIKSLRSTNLRKVEFSFATTDSEKRSRSRSRSKPRN